MDSNVSGGTERPSLYVTTQQINDVPEVTQVPEEWSVVYRWVLPSISIAIFCLVVVLVYQFPSPAHEMRNFIQRWFSREKDNNVELKENSSQNKEKREQYRVAATSNV